MIITIILLLLSLSAKAETHYLLLDGGPSQYSNYYRYYNSLRHGYEVLKSKGKNVRIYAKDGSWKVSRDADESLSNFSLTDEGKKSGKSNSRPIPTYPPIQGALRSVDDLKSSINSLGLKKGDALVLYFTAHGGAPKNNRAQSATINLWGQDLSMTQLKGLISSLPSGVRVKLATTTCYGGGIHSISHETDNVCSVATAPYFNPSQTGDWNESLFAKGFWNHLHNNEASSFASASLDGLKRQQVANPDQGRLSSFDYIDFILKKGPYEKFYEVGRSTYRETSLTETKGKRILPTGYQSSFPSDNLLNSSHNLLAGLKQEPTSSCFFQNVNYVVSNIELFENLLLGLLESSYEESIGNQDPKIKTIFHNVIDDMKKNGSKYLATARGYDRKFQDLKRRWNAHKEKFKDSWSITKWWHDEGETRAKIQKEYDDLKKAAKRDLAKFSFNQQMLDRLERLEEFNRIATPEQKKKFVQLLQCEWEPL